MLPHHLCISRWENAAGYSVLFLKGTCKGRTEQAFKSILILKQQGIMLAQTLSFLKLENKNDLGSWANSSIKFLCQLNNRYFQWQMHYWHQNWILPLVSPIVVRQKVEILEDGLMRLWYISGWCSSGFALIFLTCDKTIFLLIRWKLNLPGKVQHSQIKYETDT